MNFLTVFVFFETHLPFRSTTTHSPIYSVTSFLSLIFPSADEYLAVIKDFYEAYVIYTFLSFLIAVLGRGNRDTAVAVLAHHADHLHPPTNCLRSCYHPPPETNDKAKASAVLMECQILAMQFVLVRPATSILRFVIDTFTEDEAYNEEDPWAYFKTADFWCVDMVTNISVFFAFNGLLKFYHAVHEDLLWCRPFAKFLAIKGIVFLTFWQGLAISIIVNFNYTPDGATGDSATIATNPPAAPIPGSVATFVPGMAPLTLSPTSFEGATIDVIGNHTRFLSMNDDGIDNTERRAAQIQNFLVCLEMLFFSLAHWCVFPSEEWAPDYRPKSSYAKPGFGFKDFASDIGHIVSSSSEARKYRRSNANSRDDDCESEMIARDVPMDGRNVVMLNEENAIAASRRIPDLSGNPYHDDDDDDDEML